ncbi:TPA: hypothetical protein KD856_003987 [Vibrio parahaemolyticus]|nr:hypothetical protein [Vibrio parahaemolyticus]
MNTEILLGFAFISICVFTYQHAYVKTKRVSTQRHLLALQGALRDELLDKESEFTDDTIKTFLMVDDGLNNAYKSLKSLTLSSYVKHIISNHLSPSLEVNRDRKFRFIKRLEKAKSPLLISIVQQADELLYQQLKVNTLLAMISLLPFTIIIWFFIGANKTVQKSHQFILQTITINTFWGVQNK